MVVPLPNFTAPTLELIFEIFLLLLQLLCLLEIFTIRRLCFLLLHIFNLFLQLGNLVGRIAALVCLCFLRLCWSTGLSSTLLESFPCCLGDFFQSALCSRYILGKLCC